MNIKLVLITVPTSLPNYFVVDLVVITDGMIAMPDSDTLDSVLNHMRYNDIACNFIHVGSQFHPHCGFGFVPYAEIMQLISVATNGSYLQFYPQHVSWKVMIREFLNEILIGDLDF